MRVELNVPESVREPRMWVKHQPVLAMALRTGSIEIGLRRSEMRRFTYDTGEMSLIPRHLEKWFRNEDLHGLCIAMSDAALTAASAGTSGEVELRKVDNLVDARLGALVESINAERIAGFPSGRLFLDSVEQALAVALVNGYAVRHRCVQTHRGGLGCARVRRIKEFVDAKMEDELTLCEMAQSVELSTAHFSRMFRKSTGESPHHFVLRHRVERAKEMLRAAEARVLDVAVACGFKTQQHFARVFRRMCGVSPTEYRQEFLEH
ncbi:MAG: AraC family transcriptional regulator [Bryobacterales bacterium]|nr:AraC family transcriptional regulator [Bryobacterales bacterium]